MIDHLPWFQLADPYVRREITVRDLITHRTGFGLGAGDLLWWPPSTYDRKQIARRMRGLPLEHSFRSEYGYSNVLYLVAGEVIEAVSGVPWEGFVESRLLKPVGMEDSSVRLSDVGKAPNSATTHARIEGTVRPIAPFDSDNTNPAGGINASALDMGKWLRVHLASGRLPDGSMLFRPETAKELATLVTPRPVYDPAPGLEALRANFNGYALGFAVRDYRGHKVVGHSGGLPGYVSMVSMLPELKLGVVVLTNQESGAALSAITYHILDFYLRANDTAWLEAFKKDDARNRAEAAAADKEVRAERNEASGPSLPLANYAGLYRDSWYGDVSIELSEDGRLVMRFVHSPSLVGEMEHWQHDTFVVRWFDRELRADAFVTFALRPDGGVEQAKMKAVSEATDFSFDFHDLLLKPAPSKANE